MKPWSPLCHSIYPRSFRNAVLTVLMANGREESLPGVLPPALWMEVRASGVLHLLTSPPVLARASETFASFDRDNGS